MLVMLIAAVPVFVSVTAFWPPTPPTGTLVHVRLDGLAATLPVAVVVVPIPESAMVCGLFVAVSVKARVAVRVPVAAGLNRIVAVQLADAARLEPHVLLKIENSAALGPVIATLPIVIEGASLFVNVTDFWPPTPPTVTLDQPRLVGETTAAATQCDAGSEHSTKSAASKFVRRCSCETTLEHRDMKRQAEEGLILRTSANRIK